MELTHETQEVQLYRILEVANPITAMYGGSVQAGFPSPAADYMEEDIDFNKLLCPRPSSTVVVRATGESMIGAFIPDQAYLIVDKSIKPANNCIVVAIVNGEFTIKRFIKNSSGIRLMSANPKFQPIPITDDMEFTIWGTVTKIIIDPLKSAI